ncbi:MAG TPA: penicillin-binding transpeptidase domain-containing protein, partial [Microthrixaceae bacterium]|nr:penicillin-binding transpeptidase domain-containing protein [Microthrixaceae bacterium]
LLDERVITQSERDAIDDTPLPTVTHSRAEAAESTQLAGASYFSESVKQQLLDLPELGATPQDRYDAVFGGGLRVTTTYDPDAQHLAEQAVDSLPDTKGEFVASLASVEPASGAVRALVGGTDFKTNKFNYATQGWRQPGSSFKYFVLMAAFEYGALVPNDTISGSSPCRFPDPSAEGGVYEAENSGKGGGKTASIESQTLSSSNCAFLRLGQVVGLDKVAAIANALGVSTLVEQRDEAGQIVRGDDGQPEFVEGPVPSNVLSLPLGTKEVHPVSMAGAYAAAANDGVYHEPYVIESIQDADGKVLYQHDDPGLRVVSVQTARLVNEVLESNVTSGTGRRARLGDRPAAGKTGTTQENSDVWFAGYTPQLSTAVWIGSPDGQKPVVIRGKSQFGADEPSRIWNAFMEPYHKGLPVEQFAAAESTRKGKALKYTSTADKKRRTSSRSSARRSTTTVKSKDAETPTSPEKNGGPGNGSTESGPPPAEDKGNGDEQPKEDKGGGGDDGAGGGP